MGNTWKYYKYALILVISPYDFPDLEVTKENGFCRIKGAGDILF